MLRCLSATDRIDIVRPNAWVQLCRLPPPSTFVDGGGSLILDNRARFAAHALAEMASVSREVGLLHGALSCARWSEREPRRSVGLSSKMSDVRGGPRRGRSETRCRLLFAEVVQLCRMRYRSLPFFIRMRILHRLHKLKFEIRNLSLAVRS